MAIWRSQNSRNGEIGDRWISKKSNLKTTKEPKWQSGAKWRSGAHKIAKMANLANTEHQKWRFGNHQGAKMAIWRSWNSQSGELAPINSSQNSQNIDLAPAKEPKCGSGGIKIAKMAIWRFLLGELTRFNVQMTQSERLVLIIHVHACIYFFLKL